MSSAKKIAKENIKFDTQEFGILEAIEKNTDNEKLNADKEKSRLIQLEQNLIKKESDLEKDFQKGKIKNFKNKVENIAAHNDLKSETLEKFSKLTGKLLNRERQMIKLDKKIASLVADPNIRGIQEAIQILKYEDKMSLEMSNHDFLTDREELSYIIKNNKTELSNLNELIENKLKHGLELLNENKKTNKSNIKLLNYLLEEAKTIKNELKTSEENLEKVKYNTNKVIQIHEGHSKKISDLFKILNGLKNNLGSRESKVKYYTKDLMKRIRGAEYNTADLIKYCKEEVSGLKKEELVVQKEFIGVRQLALRFLNSPVGKLRIKNVKLKQIGQKDEKAYGNYTYELHEIMKMVEKQEYIKLGYIKTAFSTSNDFFKILRNAKDIKTFIEQFRNASKNDTKEVVHIFLEKFINLEKVFEKLKPNQNTDKLKIKNALMYAINVNAEQMKLLEKIIKTLKLYIEKKYKDRPKAKKLIDQLIIESEEIFELLRNSTRFIAKLNKYIVKDLINISKEMSVISKEMYEIKKELAKELQSTG